MVISNLKIKIKKRDYLPSFKVPNDLGTESNGRKQLTPKTPDVIT